MDNPLLILGVVLTVIAVMCLFALGRIENLLREIFAACQEIKDIDMQTLENKIEQVDGTLERIDTRLFRIAENYPDQHDRGPV